MSKEGECNRRYDIFTYDLSKLDNVTRVRFVYFLKGRNSNKGFVDELKGRFLVPGCFLLPAENSSKMEMTFRAWKVPYKKEEVLIC